MTAPVQFAARSRSALRRLANLATGPTTLRLVALAGALGWLIAFPAFVISQTEMLSRTGQPFGGDFVAFYTAGRMICAGQGESLYNLAAQRDWQASIVGGNYSDLQAYVNPPGLAMLFAPIALLPYRLAYVVTTLVLLSALIGGLCLLLRTTPALRPYVGVVIGLVWLFYPISRTVTGGQNTALTLLLLAWAYVALRGGRDALAGLALGFLTFKPHFVAIVAFLLLIRGRFLALAVIAGCAATHYALGALVCGPTWPTYMLGMLRDFWVLEDAGNGQNSISLIGYAEHWLGGRAGTLIGAFAAAAILAAVAWDWRKIRPTDNRFALYWAGAICAGVIVSPHTLWYDAALVVPAVILALDYAIRERLKISSAARLALATVFVLFPLYGPLGRIGFQPASLIPLLALLWLARLSRQTNGPLRHAGR
ncbi:MAG: glycosyltransferase family 87 protein [Phycisphaerae bacterium]